MSVIAESKSEESVAAVVASLDEEEQVKPKDTSVERKPALLVFGGSFNPVHRSHLEMVRIMKEHIEAMGVYRIIQGYLVIAKDSHVVRKCGREWAMPFETRKTICDDCIIDAGLQGWLQTSHIAHANASFYADIALSKFFEPRIKETAHIFDCWGGDHLLVGGSKLKRGIWTFYGGYSDSDRQSTIAMGREGFTEEAVKLYESDRKQGLVDEQAFIFVQKEVSSISSSEIREVIKQFFAIFSRQRSEAEDALMMDRLEYESEDDEKDPDEGIIGKDSLSMIKPETQQAFRDKLKPMLTDSCVEYLLRHWDSSQLFVESRYTTMF